MSRACSRLFYGPLRSALSTVASHLRSSSHIHIFTTGSFINLSRTVSSISSHPVNFYTQPGLKNLFAIISPNLSPRNNFLISRAYLSTSPVHNSSPQTPLSQRNRTTVKYIVAIAIAVVGLSYAAVPLYRVFCQASGYGGTVSLTEAGEKVESMEPIRERELTIK